MQEGRPNQTFSFADTSSTLTLITSISTLLMGVMLSTKIPSILGTLMSGNPSMGWGTIAETARGAAHGLHMAQHAVHSAKQVGSGIAHAGQAGVRGGMGAELDEFCKKADFRDMTQHAEARGEKAGQKRTLS